MDTRADKRSPERVEPDRRSYAVWIGVGVIVVVLIVAWLVSARSRQGPASPAPAETVPATTPEGESVVPPLAEPGTGPTGP
jgi:hypothetical protein